MRYDLPIVCESFSRLRNNLVYTENAVETSRNGADVTIASGCSKRPSSKAAASEEAEAYASVR